MKKHQTSPLLQRVRVVGTKSARIVTRTSLPEIAFISSFMIGRYLVNADFQYPSELIVPILLFAVICTVVFYGYFLLLRSWFIARVVSVLFIYSLYSYSYLPAWLRGIGQSLLPRTYETAFSTMLMTVLVLAVVSALMGLGIRYFVKKYNSIRHLQPHRIVLFAVLFICSIQAIKFTYRFIGAYPQLAYVHQTPKYTRRPNAVIQKPDIYYFVFDRYGNNDTLKTVYNYDNTPFTDYLTDKGFVTRYNAKANYPFTMQSISSTLGMQYHTEFGKQFNKGNFQSAFAYRSILNSPPIANILKQNGYRYNQVSSWWDFTRYKVTADTNPTKSFRLRLFGKNFYMSDLSRDIVNKSVLSPLLKKGLTIGSTIIIKYDNDNNPRQNFFEQEAAIQSLASTKHAQPQFTFAHFLAPHDPYIFDADGSDPAYDGGRNDDGADETVKYVKEITYLNTQIKMMVDTIRTQSPNAVIIIQSDEGPYPKEFRYRLKPGSYYDPSNLPYVQEQQKYGILASYFMPNVDTQTVEQNNTSSVNPFRFVLKHYLGYDIPMLPDCQFSAGDKYRIYNFKNETSKLQFSAADPACAKL